MQSGFSSDHPAMRRCSILAVETPPAQKALCPSTYPWRCNVASRRANGFSRRQEDCRFRCAQSFRSDRISAARFVEQYRFCRLTAAAVNHFPPLSELTDGKTDQSTEVVSFHGGAAIRYLSLATESTLPMNYTSEAPDQCSLALGLAETDGATEL
jgi:hypothetical protein